MTLIQAREQMARAGYLFVAAVEYPGEPTRWQATFIPSGSADCLLDLYCLGAILVGRFWPTRPMGRPDLPVGFDCPFLGPSERPRRTAPPDPPWRIRRRLGRGKN